VDTEEIFNAVLEQLPEGIIVTDESGIIFFVNATAAQVRGISKKEIMGRNILHCHSESSREKVKRALAYLKNDNMRAFKRMVVNEATGKVYENVYSPVRAEGGKYLGSVVLSRDITENRKYDEERALYTQNLQERLAELSEKHQNLFICALDSLVNALEAKDIYTKGHSLRVSEMALKLLEHVKGISPDSKKIEIAGKLHDIGKVGTSDLILNKAGKLTEDEYGIIKKHPFIAEKILGPIEKLKEVAAIIRHHHERYDGQGYPDGLKGGDIPECSRILAIVDTYDAMTSRRPYRPPMNPEDAAAVIRRNLGSQFDPEYGEIFLDLFYSGSIG